jgi:hypothetical protein
VVTLVFVPCLLSLMIELREWLWRALFVGVSDRRISAPAQPSSPRDMDLESADDKSETLRV